jgi:hypothetical protein
LDRGGGEPQPPPPPYDGGAYSEAANGQYQYYCAQSVSNWFPQDVVDDLGIVSAGAWYNGFNQCGISNDWILNFDLGDGSTGYITDEDWGGLTGGQYLDFSDCCAEITATCTFSVIGNTVFVDCPEL